MRWLMGEAHLWDGLCKMHAYERHAYHRVSNFGADTNCPSGPPHRSHKVASDSWNES
jgi:hypothetical protein